ncbi:unnamed protein product, partial [Porites lobata]
QIKKNASKSWPPLSRLVILSITMAGLVKPKKREWKETNMALFGSDTEREYSERLDDFLIRFISGLPKEVIEKKEEHHNRTCHAMSRFRELAFSPSF